VKDQAERASRVLDRIVARLGAERPGLTAMLCASTEIMLALYRGDRVRVLRRSADRRWARINTHNELRGWIRSGSLCR